MWVYDWRKWLKALLHNHTVDKTAFLMQAPLKWCRFTRRWRRSRLWIISLPSPTSGWTLDHGVMTVSFFDALTLTAFFKMASPESKHISEAVGSGIYSNSHRTSQSDVRRGSCCVRMWRRGLARDGFTNPANVFCVSCECRQKSIHESWEESFESQIKNNLNCCLFACNKSLC